MMERVLVAGATGYLGSYVVREFGRREYFVRALVRSPDRLETSAREAADEVVEAEVTRPETLAHVCDDIDVVFSSVGITNQKDGLTFQDVDYQGNKNLLEVARYAGVEKFIYVSVLDGPDLTHLDIIRAHEDFVAELKDSGLSYTVMRPTGFFSDMGEYVAMARKGRVYLIGRGENRINPIHGADLAVRCVDAVETDATEIPVGGPAVLTHRRIAELALEAAGRPPNRTASVPIWVMRSVVGATRLFSRHCAELLAFFATAMTRDAVGPATGTHQLSDYYAELAADGGGTTRA
jgi:uncharacterized protein YbjT (DUF2867 family)